MGAESRIPDLRCLGWMPCGSTDMCVGIDQQVDAGLFYRP